MIEQYLRDEATALLKQAEGKRLVFVSGNFNIIHPGHLRLLNFARTCGDCLIVGLFDDGQRGVVLPLEVRREALESLAAVNHVVPLTNVALGPFIRLLKPHFVVKGKEHEDAVNPEREVVRTYGGQLIFSAGEARFSTADLLRREMLLPVDVRVRHDPQFIKKHQLTMSRLKGLIEDFGGCRVLVLGDLIVDEYVACDPLGMSQEDPTIVLSPVDSNIYVGGAGIVASHMAGLGAKTSFMGVVGDDDVATQSAVTLKKYGVETLLIRDSSRVTVRKQRFRAANKTLLRVNYLRSHDAGEEQVEKILKRVEELLPSLQLVVFSDFNYGSLPQSLVDAVSARCRGAGVPFVADSQASSQVGDVSRFQEAALISATEREVRLAVNDFKSGLQNVANKLLDNSGTRMLFLKLGAEGLLIFAPGVDFSTGTLPAMNSNPVDVSGAGDAMLAAASLALIAGGTAQECAYIGSVAAAIQVSRVGNVPLERSALLRELN